MKELNKKKAGSLPEPKPPEVLSAKTGDRDEDASLLGKVAAPDLAPPSGAPANVLSSKSLLHPANAEPLANLLGQLQRSHGNTYVQQLVSDVREPKPDAASKGEGGQPLDAGTKSAMESAFGADFGDVRVHTDQQSEEATRELGARAFTQGQDIYFGEGKYDPATRAGKEVLAHELAHVVQQQGRPSGQSAQSIGQAGDSFEHEADRAAHALVSGQRPAVMSQTDAPALQRQERPARQEAPTISRHDHEILPTPSSGTISVGGRFSVAYVYNVVARADLVPLTLMVPAGVAVAVAPMTDLGSGDYRVNDPGGTGARAVTISVSFHMRRLPKIQVTFTQGSFTYLVVFQFPQSS